MLYAGFVNFTIIIYVAINYGFVLMVNQLRGLFYTLKQYEIHPLPSLFTSMYNIKHPSGSSFLSMLNSKPIEIFGG